jgi:hypothetical protein
MYLGRCCMIAVLLMALVTPAFSRPLYQSRTIPKIRQANLSGLNQDLESPNRQVFSAAVAGTTFYGGTFWAADSQRWEAFENQLWTFDTGVGSAIVPPGGPASLSQPTANWVNPYKRPGQHATMEGWIGFDNTFSKITYFRRIASNDPRWTNAVCTGAAAGLGGTYSYWCGVFPSEADQLCYKTGQGYGNAWNVCLEHTFDYLGGAVTLGFKFKNDTEDGFDYTHVYVDTTGDGDNVEVVAYTGTQSGTANFPLTRGIELPMVPKPITVRFCVASDGAWSDQDGLNPTQCGAFAVDNITLSGAITHLATFETSDDGWHLANPPEGLGGEWSNIYTLSDLPPPLAPCPCALSDSVLAFPDQTYGWFHTYYQDNLAASPWIDIKAYGKVGSVGKIIKTNIYADLPLRNYIFTHLMAQWYPETCLLTGKLATSAWTDNGFLYYFGGVPTCTSTLSGDRGFQLDFSGVIPPGAEEVRIALGVLSYCKFLECSGISNSTPWFDFVGLGVYGSPNQTLVFTDPIGRAQDSFPEDGSISLSATGRIDCNDVLGYFPEFPSFGPDETLGDTLVVRGGWVNAEVYVHFRVTPGPGINTSNFNAWYHSHAVSSIDPGYRVARCDTAESGFSGPVPGVWMTSYHESDPNFAVHGATDRTLDPTDITTNGGQWRLSHDIFPDHLLTTGTHIDYFFSANRVGSSESQVDPPTAPAKPYDMDILPAVAPTNRTYNCVLYVDHAGGSARTLIETALGSVLGFGPGNYEGTKWDRYDVGAPLADNGLGRPPYGDYGATASQLLSAYRVILWDSGNSENALNDYDASVLIPWLTEHAFDYNSLYLSGNWLVHEAVSGGFTKQLIEHLAGVKLKTSCSFQYDTCPNPPFTYPPPSDLTPCLNLLPMPRAPVAGSSPGRTVTHVAQGNGCPEFRAFHILDVAAPDYGTAAGDEMYVSPNKFSRFASVVTDAASSGTLHYKIVTEGLSLIYRRDGGTPCDFATGGKTAITERLREVLSYFDFCPSRPTTGVIGEETPPRTLLNAFWPNPFRAGDTGHIRYSLAQDATATIEVLDLQGRRVRTVFDGTAKKGQNEATWDGRDNAGEIVGSGVYFYRFQALDQDQTRKLVIVGGRN